MNEFKVITVCNRVPVEPYYCLQQFVTSLRDTIPLVLGSIPGEYGGLGSKPRLLYNAIKNGLVKEEYSMVCDCFDLVFAESPKEAFSWYRACFSDAPVVISSEKNCFPDTLKGKFDEVYITAVEDKGYKPDCSPFKYLNSGMIVGKTEAILTILESMDAKNIPNDYWDSEKQIQVNPNDQEYYQKEFFKQPVPIELDYLQSICNTLHSMTVDEFDFSGKRIFNKTIKGYSASYHFNGNAKTSGLREPILSKLNLL